MNRLLPSGIDRIGVVIPARNEQDLLPGCLAALATACRQVRHPVTVIVVLDSCTDESAAVVARTIMPAEHRLLALCTSVGSVGHARRVGMERLLSDGGPAGLWLATTDADSTVPADWLQRQLAHHARGIDAVVGTVQIVDWAGHTAATRQQYLAEYTARDGHRHTHGANLSMSAAAYVRAGGFCDLAAHEDVALVSALVATDCTLAWAADLPVTTSARAVGRASIGFAQHLQLIAADQTGEDIAFVAS